MGLQTASTNSVPNTVVEKSTEAKISEGSNSTTTQTHPQISKQLQANLAKMEAMMNEVNKYYKAPLMVRGKKDYSNVKRIPSGALALNYSLYGGIAEGIVIEFSGLEGSGKSSLAYDTVAQFQKAYPDKLVFYGDTEHALSEEWAEVFGVDFSRVYQFMPLGQAAEDTLQSVIDAISTGACSLVVVDSIIAQYSKHEQESSLEDSLKVGGLSMIIQRFINKAVPLLTKYNCTLLIINQLRDVIGSFVPMKDTPGGLALKFAASLRIKLKKSDPFDEKGVTFSKSNADKTPAGHVIKYYVEKNKKSRDDRKHGQINLYYDSGFDAAKDLWSMLYKACVTHQIKGKVQLDDISVPQEPGKSRPILFEVDSIEEAQEKLRQDPELFKKCYEFVFS